MWIYKKFTEKFTGGYRILKDRFPVLEQKPLLRYSLVPFFIGFLFLLRYLLKFVVNEMAAWTSGILGENSGFIVSEKAVIVFLVALLIGLRVGLKLKAQRKRKNQLEIEG